MQASEPESVLPSYTNRRLISDAIHESICEVINDNGRRQCAIYAVTTMLVMEQLTGARYVLQAGMLSIRLSENYRRKNPEGFTHFTMDGRPPYPGAPSRVENTLPEFHAWCGRIHSGSSEVVDDISRHELIDLSARHYPYFVQAIDPEWPGPEDFSEKELWTTGDKLPEGIILIPDEATTMAVAAKLTANPELSIIRRTTIKALKKLKAVGLSKL
jgi:hypothetical protein